VLSAWTFEPQIVLGLVLLAVIYLAGLRDLARRGRLWHTVQPYQTVLFALGIFSLVLALLSPLDTLDGQVFTFHMTQHLLLLEVAPPLLLLGKPIPVLLVGLPRTLLRRATRAYRRTGWLEGLTHFLFTPVVVWAFYVGDLFLWHLPALYQATLTRPGLHLLEHLCFLTSGVVFWWVVLEPWPGTRRLHAGMRMAYDIAAMLPMGMLGALFTLVDTLWYPYYATHTLTRGLSPIDDQRLGGLIMWLAGSLIYMAAAGVLFFVMLAADEREQALEADDPIGDAALHP
jgi:cytochrome c oxidase assembly factor CtaG